MLVLPALAAVGASFGWATGIVLAQKPAKLLGAFEFTRIQLIACSAILAAICSVLGYWHSVDWGYWPAFAASTTIGIVLGNLTMIECLRRAGPRRTELLMSLKAPVVAAMAYVWFNEVPTGLDFIGAIITLTGICLAIFYGGNDKSESDVTSGRMITILILGVSATGFQVFVFWL